MQQTIGQRIRALRHKKRISQEKLAERLNVSFQAVSKWENDLSLPDVMQFPALAEFFGVSTDALFGLDGLETERRIEAICRRSWECRDAEPEQAEAILREGLERYPGNPILLNNLLYVIRTPERRQEVVRLCRLLTENSADYDDVRFDAWRILAETYAEMGEQLLAQEAVRQLPEIYFTRLEVAAENLDGPAGREAALKQRNLAADSLIRMLRRLAEFNRREGAAQAAEANERLIRQLLGCVGDFHDPFGDGRRTLSERYATE